ncbi:MAG: PPC domain-containing protein [Bryobacterales bacterium]|nr:PPC domain-containing protein [Bryobacterales bacterium]
MLLTSGNCLITQPEADSAAVVWTRPEQCGNAAEAGQQTVGAVLLVAFPHPLQGFSLLRLSSSGQIAQPAEASQAGFCNIAVDEALRKSADAYAQISLFWKEDPARSAPGGCQTQSIQPSAGIAGALTTGDCVVEGAFYADRYTFTAPAKAQTSISVSSTAFDSYVLLYAPDGSLLAANDDGGVGFNARIPPVGRLTLPSSGTYTVEVSSFKPFEVGAYNVFQELSGAPLGPYRFVPVTPCRVMDTRAEGGMSGLFGPPFLARNTTRVIPLTGKCDIPADATGYSLNITAVPRGPLGFLTAFPAGLRQPPVSTLNSMDGRIAANAALIPAGENGAISLFVSNDTDVVLDVNGFFTR